MKQEKAGMSVFSILIGLFSAILMVSAIVMPSMAYTPIPDYHDVWIEMTNGARYADLSSGGANESYFFKLEGGGLNQLHITDSPSVHSGQVTHRGTVSSDNGTFYICDTGGRGWNDDIILMVAVEGEEVPTGFNLHINASGYRWDPVLDDYTPVVDPEDDYYWGSIDEDFTSANFTYGPQDWKPSTSVNYPIFYPDPESDCVLSFIDLKVGDIGKNNTTGQYNDTLKDTGAVKIIYNITGIDSKKVAFNAYAWCNSSHQGTGVSWTNDLTGTSKSGWDFNN